MNPAINRGSKGLGRSFKGVTLYLTTPKRDDPAQAERAGFIETRNLPTDDAGQAWRIMAQTAQRAEQLKAAAGVKAAGRKLAQPVFHYSLNWHPTETPTPEQMLKAADATLKLLGLDGHQSLIVQHTDEPHPHLHIVVNRVHPETGKAADLSNNWRKLDRWAADYERENGNIVSLDRAKKYADQQQGQKARSDKARAWLPHDQWTQQKAAERADQMEDRAALFSDQQAVREAFLEGAKKKARSVAQQLRAEQRPAWSALGRQQAKQRRDLTTALDSRAGIYGFVNQHREQLLKAFDTHDDAKARWGELLSPEGLKNAVKRAQEIETAELRRDCLHDQHTAQRAFWGEYREKVQDLRAAQKDERSAFRDAQKAGDAPAPKTQVQAPPDSVTPATPAQQPATPAANENRRTAAQPGRYDVLKPAEKKPAEKIAQDLPPRIATPKASDPRPRSDDLAERVARKAREIEDRRAAAKARQERIRALGLDRDRER